LHQTDVGRPVRRDGSIRAEDIRLFLVSRYGVVVTNEEVETTILPGFGGRKLNVASCPLHDATAAEQPLPKSDVCNTNLHRVRRGCDHPAPKLGEKPVREGSGHAMEVDDQSDRASVEDFDGECIDLMELVTMLLIPTVCKASIQHFYRKERDKASSFETDKGTSKSSMAALPEGVIPAPEDMIEYVLKVLLHDVFGTSRLGPILSIESLRQVCRAYGEESMAQDDELLAEMISAAKKPRIEKMRGAGEDDLELEGQSAKQELDADEAFVLDADAFARGLSHDIHLYDIRNETSPTTHFDDVFLTHQLEKLTRSQKRLQRQQYAQPSAANAFASFVRRNVFGASSHMPNDVQGQSAEENTKRASTQAELPVPQSASSSMGLWNEQSLHETLVFSSPLKRKYTASTIDITAGTYRSKGLFVALWATVLITYFGYVSW
jgi:hypothetical protein